MPSVDKMSKKDKIDRINAIAVILADIAVRRATLQSQALALDVQESPLQAELAALRASLLDDVMNGR